MAKPNDKTSIVTFRLTKDQLAALRRTAKHQNIKPATLIRDLVLKEIGRFVSGLAA